MITIRSIQIADGKVVVLAIKSLGYDEVTFVPLEKEARIEMTSAKFGSAFAETVESAF